MPEMKTLTVNGTQYEVVDAKARGDFESHASRHASGGADPIAPAMIGAFPKNGPVVTSFPTEEGVYTTVSNIFANMTPSWVFGTLVIVRGTAYATYIYTSASDIKMGTTENGSIEEPTNWRALATTETALLKTNKPSGSYTGNGDAGLRTIATGGIGHTVVIWSGDSIMILTPLGGFGKTGTEFKAISYTSGSFTPTNGIAFYSTDVALNANGVTYYYQVL